MAVDIVPEAVALAEANRQRLGLNNVNVILSNWLESVAPQAFDLIVTNPPYIDVNDQHLKEGDVRFEPESALVSGDKGLADIRIIIAEAKRYLEQGGCLLIEHGYQQAGAVCHVLRDVGYRQVSTRQDLAGRERLSLGYF